MESSFIEQVSTWGRVFEIAVQRGVLAYIIHQKLLPVTHPVFAPWNAAKVSHVHRQLLKTLNLTDPNAKEWVSSMLRHTLVLGYGLGWTAIRECLQRSPIRKPKIEAIWCPLTLPGQQQEREAEIEETARQFHSAFNLPGYPDKSLLRRGQPARADLILWFSSQNSEKLRTNAKTKCENFILCFEFSYNAPTKLMDFTQEQAHREEIARYARQIESRGVFSKLCAEVDGENFSISSSIANHLAAFSSQDKPLFKLCQAASYTERLVHLLESCGRLHNCQARAIAVTSNGLESVSANFAQLNDPKVQLIKQLGRAYRDVRKLDDDAPEQLNQEIKLAFNKLIRSLPKNLKQQAKQLITQNLGEKIHFLLQEEVEEFYNLAQELPRDVAVSAIEESLELNEFFCTSSPKAEFVKALNSISQQDNVSLRQIHQAAVIAGLNCAQTGRLNVIALEGNPGIGKTTAVMQYLKEQAQGFIFLYFSPRVVINRDVTAKLSLDRLSSDILTVTTNANLIAAAPKWHEKQVQLSTSPPRHIDSAAIVDGIKNLIHPEGNILFLTPDLEQQIDENVVASNRIKKSRNERQDSVESRHRPGVLRTLATGVRKLLDANPKTNRIALTAAIQGYRTFDQKSTIEALDNLFTKKFDTKQGQRERIAFFERIPTVIVMIDELTGDGAGAPFVHKLATWLSQQFIEPFASAGTPSPFKVILIVSDASLSNEVVFNNYLNSGDRAPNKILISPCRGQAPFRVAGTYTKIGIKKHPTMHLMTNSYPASRLKIDYSIRLIPITPIITNDGKKQPIRQAIREQSGETLLKNAYLEIKRGLNSGAKQIVFFAQDKAFLRDLKVELTTGANLLLPSDLVAVLDQSVQSHQRLALIQPPQRDRIKVFLMTSSGARGVSLPLTNWIIASIPRFNIEDALMEVTQLIYRGRGTYTDLDSGLEVSGDDTERQLVMLINDFIIEENVEQSSSAQQSAQARLWLRQASDLSTLLVMLRSTIHTRIKGDAGLKNQQLAFVPVGLIGDRELATLISDDVGNFLRESRVFIREEQSDEARALVRKAEQLIEDSFTGFKLTGESISLGNKSYADPHTLKTLTTSISRISSSLLVDVVSSEDLVIPDNITCIGPFWIEDWSDRQMEGQFTFEGWRTNIQSQSSQLLGLLTRIYEGNNFPPKLKRPAKELYKLLIRSKNEAVREYSTIQTMRSQNAVISLPLDYPHFWQEQLDDEMRQQVLEDPGTWHSALGRTLTPLGFIMPVLPYYKTFPWAAVVGQRVLQELESIFDSRYFMVSSELNLLNTILLEDKED